MSEQPTGGYPTPPPNVPQHQPAPPPNPYPQPAPSPQSANFASTYPTPPQQSIQPAQLAPPPVRQSPIPQSAVDPSQPLPQVAPTGMEAPKPLESVEKLSLMNLLNKIKCDNIVLTDSIGLGDALSRLAVAIGRSGVRFDTNGNPTQKQINKELGKLLQETLNRIPRTVDYQNTSIGYDPTRPMFYEGEALSVPINAEMVMLLKLKGPKHVFPLTDMDDHAANGKLGR